MDIVKAIEIFALVTGIPYIILEVMQKNSMWYFGIASGIGCAVSFAIQGLWASMGLNIYYVFMSLWGLYQWKKDSDSLAMESASSSAVHLSRLTPGIIAWSAAVFLAGLAGLIALLSFLNDTETVWDAVVTMMSVVGTYWLAKAYLPHWIIWIVSDLLLIVLCAMTGMFWMSLLYLAYTISSVVGLVHWRRNGVYVA